MHMTKLGHIFDSKQIIAYWYWMIIEHYFMKKSEYNTLRLLIASVNVYLTYKINSLIENSSFPPEFCLIGHNYACFSASFSLFLSFIKPSVRPSTQYLISLSNKVISHCLLWNILNIFYCQEKKQRFYILKHGVKLLF